MYIHNPGALSGFAVACLLACLIEGRQHAGRDNGPKSDLAKQGERSEQQKHVHQELHGVGVSKLRVLM